MQIRNDKREKRKYEWKEKREAFAQQSQAGLNSKNRK